MQITEVVKHLLIINVLVYFGALTFFRDSQEVLYLYYPATSYFKPYQIVSHMFMHGSTSHLFFNMMSLFFIGPMLESLMGSKRFLSFYLLCGLGAMLVHLGSQYYAVHFLHDLNAAGIPVVGASGAITGIFLALAILFPDVEMYMLFIPIPIKAKYLAIIFILVDLFFGLTGIRTGIAHYAHLGGALTAFLLIWFWRKNGNFYQR